MYITPRTDIRLLRGCPCDPEHVHTLYFNSASAQTSYFMGLTKYNLNNYTYQRYAKNILRVQILADNIYDVNYMMFRNSAYGDKWFYAFVDRVEYLNDATTEIEYHIDDIQTWLFDMQLNQCFIERMHSVTDNAGDNIVPEPIELGEYVYNTYKRLDKYRSRAIIVAITDVDVDGNYISDGEVYDGIYGACQLYAFTATNAQGVNDLLNQPKYQKAPDAVVAIYMCPLDLLEGNHVDDGIPLSYGSSGVGTTFTSAELGDIGTTLDGYRVKNKKLLTYPYNFLNITNGEGASLALRYEFFDGHSPRVNVFGNISQPVQMVCCPTNYKNVNVGTVGSNNPNLIDEKLVLAGFPCCSWNVDAYKAWVAQNSIPIALNLGESAISLGAAISTGSATATIAAGASSIHKIMGVLKSQYKASIEADLTRGNISSGNASYSEGEYVFHHGRMSVNKLQAEIIDDFFTRFGYAINKIDTPRIHTRAEWTYIKTIDCTCHGSIPVDSEKNIEDIFNNGITFWVNPAHVGDYRYTNSPLQ